MKKLYTIILALLISNMLSYAQPVLNASDFAPTTAYDLDGYSISDVSGLSPGASGANATWNFSGLTGTFDSKISVVPVGSTPYAATYPTANFCFKSLSQGNEDYYDYYKVTAAGVESVGSRDSGVPYLEIDHSILFSAFPYKYLDSFQDTYQSEGDPSAYTYDAIYDSYGTLTTPYGTTNNVMRQKKVEVDGDYTYTDYLWFTASPFKIVMSMNFLADNSGNSSNYVAFYTPTPLGVKENKAEIVISIYPNPATSVLNLHLSNNKTIDKVTITDVTGKIVKKQTENTAQINVEKLAPGLYVTEIYSGNEKFTSKFIKE